ncbi:RNA methyltransferase, putative [Plasmodium ovale]|uniref:16S rRNA (uracil(1498)-N(3))-methyltransferase n=2 Tax=Plasmodium ovale TaxID=36330 RepID=A0A1A8WSH5_PLAOA|nr:RNA methyltransferase, putative [Plasmodium ovale curtisi]SBS94287.1 RNA methyltransferase, putative [Plasmodium ovale curtisi]SCP05046.1 RNA methyltransferase, putative [Plasmodium ovale]
MNLILISINSIYEKDDCFLFKTDARQTSHLKNILKVKPNQIVKVGVINKGKGEGVVIKENTNFYIIKLLAAIHFNKPEENFLPIDVVLCIPRPKVLNKSLQQLASIGVKKIIIVFSEHSNKSYESSKFLKNEEIKQALQLGLEQAMCTQFPEIYIHYSFSSFFMNIQKYSDENTIKLCAHTDIKKKHKDSVEYAILNKQDGKILLMLGCERGFSELEIYLINRMNFHFLHLTERILKCETALLVIIGQLLLLTENVSLRPSGKKMRRSSKNIHHFVKADEVEYSANEEENAKKTYCTQNDNYGSQSNEEIISEIENVLSSENSFSERLINCVRHFLRGQVKGDETNGAAVNPIKVNGDTCEDDAPGDILPKDGDSAVLNEGTDVIDSLLRTIHSFSSEEGNDFQGVYLSLLLKKIKYKNKFFLAYGDTKRNVDDDGIFIYRTQRYISKKK